MLGKALGNQEFLNTLAKEKPSLFEKVFNYVKNVLFDGQKTGKTLKERQQLNKIQSMFGKAMNEAYTIQTKDSKTKFSIQENSDGSKYVKIDTDQDIFEGKTKKEQNNIARQYILDKFRESGLIVADDYVNVNRRSANKYTTPNPKLTNESKNVKIKASTELDNLLAISKFKNSLPDDGRHSFAKDGWDYYETIFKVKDDYFTGLINIGKNGDNKYFYDITDIKKTTLSNRSDNTDARLSESSSVNNISQNSNNVKHSVSETNTLESRVSRDKLLDTEDNELKNRLIEKYIDEYLIMKKLSR